MSRRVVDSELIAHLENQTFSVLLVLRLDRDLEQLACPDVFYPAETRLVNQVAIDRLALRVACCRLVGDCYINEKEMFFGRESAHYADVFKGLLSSP